MAEYIERTEKLILAVNAGARAIEQSKRFYGATYCMDVFSNNPKEIPYVEAANILRCFDEIPAADVVSRAAFAQVMWERDTAMEQLEEHGIPFGGKADVVAVKHGRWLQPNPGECFCSECKTLGSPQWKRCPVCEAKMDGGDNDA